MQASVVALCKPDGIVSGVMGGKLSS